MPSRVRGGRGRTVLAIHGAQAPHPRRYARLALERRRPSPPMNRTDMAPANCFARRAGRFPSETRSSSVSLPCPSGPYGGRIYRHRPTTYRGPTIRGHERPLSPSSLPRSRSGEACSPTSCAASTGSGRSHSQHDEGAAVHTTRRRNENVPSAA